MPEGKRKFGESLIVAFWPAFFGVYRTLRFFIGPLGAIFAPMLVMSKCSIIVRKATSFQNNNTQT